MQKIYHRKDLRCPTDCNLPLYYRRFRRIGCCDCQSCSLYDIQLVTLALKHLGIEIQIVHQDGLKDYYTLWHQHGNLTDVPINTCKVNGTMFKIDLSFNKIQIMTRITCLQMLDTLILRGNQIQFINNQDILSLKFIRKLDLSFNEIKHIEPGLAIDVHGNLFNFDVSHNRLTSADITDCIMSKQPKFCTIDYSHNEIKCPEKQ